MPSSFGPLDCGDNSCRFATSKGGMRTNGGCRCLDYVHEKGAKAMLDLIVDALEKRATLLSQEVLYDSIGILIGDELRNIAKLIKDGEFP